MAGVTQEVANRRAQRERSTRTTELLGERGATHGEFADNARIGQHLRAYYRTQPGWLRLTDVQREALDYDIGKTSRILSGQGGYPDHWNDKAGYATLAANEKGAT